jgi:hypothetical protein
LTAVDCGDSERIRHDPTLVTLGPVLVQEASDFFPICTSIVGQWILIKIFIASDIDHYRPTTSKKRL